MTSDFQKLIMSDAAAGLRQLKARVTDLESLEEVKNNLAAVAAPTANDDAADGYSAGSIWIYDSVAYINVDATEGAAVWVVSGVSGALVTDFDTGWVAPTLTDSWVNFGGGYSPAGYRMRPDGSIALRGLVKDGTLGPAARVFDLPAGYRPTGREVHSVYLDTGLGRVDIQTDGKVSVITGSSGWVSLSGITFFTD